MKSSSKFVFDIDYQWEILKFIIVDPNGYKALKLVDENYFALLSHQVILHSLKIFYSKVGRIPKNKVNFKSEIKETFKTKKYAQSLREEDRKEILNSIDTLFSSKIKDGDLIFESCKKFASFIQVKKVIEDFDITNFSEYEAASSKLQRAVTHGVELDETSGEFLFRNLANRQFRRQHDEDIIPTPFKQINQLTNGGGFTKGSVVVAMDKGKGGKTAFLVNVGRGYLKQRKKVCVIDLENGEDSYAIRYEQAILKATKREVKSGELDNKLQKISRKYMRLGCEAVIKRLPAGSTANDIDKFLDLCKSIGYSFKTLIIDYIGIMGSISGKTDDKDRISDAYLDVKNLAHKWDLDIIWTGHHITREAYKRRSTKYEPTDTAKCIDINRHVDAQFGLNQNQEEIEAGVIRLETVDIRDGVQDSRAYFWMDLNTQRFDEFTTAQVLEYQKQVSAPTESVSSNKGKGADI